MRVIVPALLLILSSLPLVAAGPVDATDCDDKDPRVAAREGCYALAYDPATGTYAACVVNQQLRSSWEYRAAGCYAGGSAGWAGASCGDARWRDPYSENAQRWCDAGAGDASGKGVFASCTEGSERSPARNVTWHECFLGDLDGDGAPDADASCSMRNFTTMEPTKLEFPDLRCAGNVTVATLLAGHYTCERTSGGGDPDVGCDDDLQADLDGDGSPDAACRSEGNVTKKQKQWLPSNFRCAAGPDDDGDGAPDTAVGCDADDGIAIDHEGVQRCKWYVPDMDSDGEVSASFHNLTYTATATLSDGTTEDLRCAPQKEPGTTGDGQPACATATKWKVYTPLPGAFSSGRCDGGSSGAWAACEWDGPAGPGSAAHYGAPPTHSNVVVADVDRDGRPDLFVYENGGAASVFANAGGCFVSAGVKPGEVPSARSCLA